MGKKARETKKNSERKVRYGGGGKLEIAKPIILGGIEKQQQDKRKGGNQKPLGISKRNQRNRKGEGYQIGVKKKGPKTARNRKETQVEISKHAGNPKSRRKTNVESREKGALSRRRERTTRRRRSGGRGVEKNDIRGP